MTVGEINCVHNSVLEVNLDALKYNIDYFKSKLNADTKLICMLKAEAYGMGAVRIAHYLQRYGCHYLAVAYASEGIVLRQAGVELPIIVLDPMDEVVESMVEYNLEPEVFSFEFLEQLTLKLRKMGVTDYPIHIKVDSGMHRAGFQQQELAQLLTQLREMHEVKVVSVFSHLVGADEAEFDDYTREQIDYFSQFASQLIEGLNRPIMRHILNSSGIERFPEAQMEMVRLGIGMWGVSANGVALRNVVSLKSRVSQLRDVAANETVGYSRRGVLKRDSRIALVPIGYADGVDRRLGNGHLSVKIGDTFCPIVGNVCMDLMMVDVTDAPLCSVGDEVVIFGDEQNADYVANILDTIPYEVLTSIAPRVRRRYVKG